MGLSLVTSMSLGMVHLLTAERRRRAIRYVTLTVPKPSLGDILERDAELTADVADAEVWAVVIAVPDPAVRLLLDVEAGPPATAAAAIGELFGRLGLEAIQGGELGRLC
jgi:hypothetical protein